MALRKNLILRKREALSRRTHRTRSDIPVRGAKLMIATGEIAFLPAKRIAAGRTFGENWPDWADME